MTRADQSLRITVLNGPNLNLLGTREPHLYGALTLGEIVESLAQRGHELGASVESFQSNSEGALVDRIQADQSRVDGFVVNAAAYTHTSVAIRDALLAANKPFVEVHLTNPHARESFRHRSLLLDVAAGCVAGFGPRSYTLGLEGLVDILRRSAG